MDVDYTGEPSNVHMQHDTLARMDKSGARDPEQAPTKVKHLKQAIAATLAAGVTGPVLTQLKAILATAMFEEADTDAAEAYEDGNEDYYSGEDEESEDEEDGDAHSHDGLAEEDEIDEEEADQGEQVKKDLLSNLCSGWVTSDCVQWMWTPSG